MERLSGTSNRGRFNGAYEATVKVDVPTFQRELTDKDLWSKPVYANFHFKLMNGKLTEVSALSR